METSGCLLPSLFALPLGIEDPQLVEDGVVKDIFKCRGLLSFTCINFCLISFKESIPELTPRIGYLQGRLQPCVVKDEDMPSEYERIGIVFCFTNHNF